MKSKALQSLLACAVGLSLATPAQAQITNFSKDVNAAINNGLNWLDTSGYFSGGAAGDAAGLVVLALLEKRTSEDQNAVGQGYSGATAPDQARITSVINYLISDAGNPFFAYRNGQELMALSVYLRTGGPSQAAALAALNTAFDETSGVVPADVSTWGGYWCYTDGNCPDASTTQFVVSGLAAARAVYSDPAYSDAVRLARLDAMTARTAAVYAAHGNNCPPGGVLTATESGHGYGSGSCNSFQQTGSGIWIQLVGGSDLNSPGVQAYLEWIRNRYRFVDNANNEWGNASYGYGLWSTSKALAFLDASAAVPTGSNLSTASLGLLTAADAPAYAFRQTHIDPSTAVRPALFGPEGAGYYADLREQARWYFDFAYTVISQQQPDGWFASSPFFGIQAPEQAYHILILQRSVGGGCIDSDGDGACDADDNCPQVDNESQADADTDGQGDACDACPSDADNDADHDGVCGNVDNCATANPDQADSDLDGLGDACDACALDAANDADGDGVCGNVDNCATANPDQLDSDRDGVGDACDACALDASNDADADGVCGNVDNCPAAANANQADSDGDGIGDVCDTINPPSCDDGSSDDHNPKHKHVHGKGHSSHGKGKGKGHDGKSCDDGSSDDKSSDDKSGKSRDKSDDKSGKGKAGKDHHSGKKPAVAPKPAPKKK